MKVKIYQKEFISGQHHGVNNGPWLIKYLGTKKDLEKNHFISQDMNWHGSNDMYEKEVELEFPSKEIAVSFAKKHKYTYEIINPIQSEFKKKNYLNIFKK